MDHNRPAFTRRQFLHSGLTLASAAATVPWFINRSALALPGFAAGMSSIPGVPEDHILVVVQLSGGNDGLNTVVPFGMPEYYKARPGIGIAENAVLKLDKARGIGLHPQMTGLKSLYDGGLLAVVQGVGYPNPNRSHFKSMDIWHTADTTATGNGWLGRYFDSKCCGFGKGESGKAEGKQPAQQPGIAIGRTAPLAMQGQRVKPIAFETEDLFRWIGQDVHPALNDPYKRLESREPAADVPAESNAAFLMRTAMDAQVSSDLIRKAVRTRPMVAYPQNNDLAQQLAMVGSMIRAGLPTRVYYVSLGGFDTHAGQGGAQGGHANLLNRFASAVQAFYADLKAQGNDGRVLTMSFSEFGRRVGQNASQGTDHGTAAPMFLMGPMVKPGVVGEHPSLTDLDDGDLKYRIDFRSVYAAILSKWMGADAKAVLEGTFKPADVIKA
ncbi:MAG: DUF1501 domain-containing protein [Phycisphaerae bacterium]|nr:DUF1501 domain-containing protein [Phycisphaerae bacterium]